MSIKEFDSRFGLTATLEEERKRFVVRIETSLFRSLRKLFEADEYENIFRKVCYQLGIDPRKFSYRLPLGGRKLPEFFELSEGDFVKVLRTFVALYHCVPGHIKMALTDRIHYTMNMSSVELGVSWEPSIGVFYPTGEPLLDKELVSGALKSLEKFPNEQKDISIALDHYQRKRLDGVVENCYNAVEGLSRRMLNNNKTLLNNKIELLQTVGFSKYWGNILASFIEYANEYRRHAGEERHDLKPSEVEAFLYLTCLLTRAILGSKEPSI